MKRFNRITKVGIGIMLFGLLVGLGSIVIGIFGISQATNTLDNLMWLGVVVMWLLFVGGAAVGFIGIFRGRYHD